MNVAQLARVMKPLLGLAHVLQQAPWSVLETLLPAEAISHAQRDSAGFVVGHREETLEIALRTWLKRVVPAAAAVALERAKNKRRRGGVVGDDDVRLALQLAGPLLVPRAPTLQGHPDSWPPLPVRYEAAEASPTPDISSPSADEADAQEAPSAD
jgi:hypothetical protein